jgi:metal-dependent amidase/aminoacylase/carboxypeptidase family protein
VTVGASAAQQLTELSRQALARRADFEELSRLIHSHPETAFQERFASQTLAERLAAQGLSVEPPSFANPVGSSDVGNVSLRFPTIQPYLQIADRGTPSHSEAFRDAAISPRAHEAAVKMAVGLARTGLDLLGDPAFLEQVREEFASSGPDVPEDAAD